MSRVALLFALCLVLFACSRERGDTVQGYVDAKSFLIASQVTGRITAVHVTEGDRVNQGALLVELDDRDAVAARASAAAKLAQAESEAQRGQATLVAAAREFERITALRARRVASERDLDTARQANDVAQANVGALGHQLEAARAALAQAEWQLGERKLSAPSAGRIEEVYFRPGEVAPAGRPLLSLLPGNEMKVVFFVPQEALSRVAPGTDVTVSCDGCGASLAARVTYVAAEAEFTPPVIYSVQAREKLVFKVEARANGALDRLRIGQPVDIRLPEPAR